MLAVYSVPYNESPTAAGAFDKPGMTLTLTKQFRGLELNQAVRLLDASPTQARLQATDPMLVPLLEGSVYLHSQVFSRPIAGHIQELHYEDGVFLLSDFTDLDWKARQSERVQPKEPAYLTLHWKHKEARLCLEDISVLGIGASADRELFPEVKIKPGQVVHLDFSLPGFPFQYLEARLLYQVRMGQWLEKVGLRLFPTTNERRRLGQYVTQRREEILEEVSQIYVKMHQPRGVESQYF